MWVEEAANNTEFNTLLIKALTISVKMQMYYSVVGTNFPTINPMENGE